ncbi:hypothetical protein E4U19_008200 [Claviceps sp. Clav32 group G5]|nr:hypothetical protein E4U19_008200 [Claviceps sp. Clav32 group G5]
MNLVYVLNPPDEGTPQIPRGPSSDFEGHVTPTPIFPRWRWSGNITNMEEESPFQDNLPAERRLLLYLCRFATPSLS